MSIQVMSRVWAASRQAGGALVVLLAIADFADDQGVAYPSIPTLACKARLSERQVQRVIAELVGGDELMVEPGQGRHGSHLYRVIVGCGRHSATGDTMSHQQAATRDKMSPPRRRRRRETVTSATSVGVTPVSLEPSSPEPSRTITPLPPSAASGRQRRGEVVGQEPEATRSTWHQPAPVASPPARQLVASLYRGLGSEVVQLTSAMLARELAIAEQLLAVGATPAEAEAYAREMRGIGARLAPIDVRSFERERASWLARRRAVSASVRYIDRTGQGSAGEADSARPIRPTAGRSSLPGLAQGVQTSAVDGVRSSTLIGPSDWAAAVRRRLDGTP
jgi:hypothetical protein